MKSSVTRRLRGKHALITGGSEGIGLAIARRLVMYGASVTLLARNKDKLLEAQRRLTAEVANARCSCLAVDVSDEDQVGQCLASEISQRPVDFLFNNAGVSRPGEFWNIPSHEFRRQMDVNILGVVHVTRATLPSLLCSGDPHIINIGSLAGVISVYGQSAYCASKFALYGFSEVLRSELRQLGIRVTLVLPPETETRMLDAEKPFMPKVAESLQHAAGRLSADAVARAILIGMHSRSFEVIPGFWARMTRFTGGIAPNLVRAYSDWVVSRG